ncbi:MAG: cof [Enterobacter kobei]|nr:cof [Enterobacter kobei]
MARLAAFDMDGTLLMPDHRLGEQTLDTLRRLRDRDITLAFATGRHALEMRHLLGMITLDAYLITGNGTRIHSLEGELLHRQDLSPDVAEQVIHSRWDTQASLHVFNDSGWLTGEEMPMLLDFHIYSGFKYRVVDLKALSPHEVTTILSERLGIAMEECMAFGDAMNDHEMLAAVGRGMIMGNAMPQLRAALPHLPVIGHCQNQAVSHYLTHWLTTPHLPYSPE